MKFKICSTLFFSMFRISAFTFGGGYIIIPLIRKQFVEKLEWLSEEEMLDIIAMAQSSPGAVALNVASQLGYRAAGASGMLCAILGTMLPPFVWISIISTCYDAFRTSPVIDAFLRSMQPAVAAVILCAAVDLFQAIRHKQRSSGWLLFGAALVLGLYGVNVIFILLGGGIIGAGILTAGGKSHAD